MRNQKRQKPPDQNDILSSLLVLQAEQTQHAISTESMFSVNSEDQLIIHGVKPPLSCSLAVLEQWLQQKSRYPLPQEPEYSPAQWWILRAAYVVYWWKHFKPKIAWQETTLGQNLLGKNFLGVFGKPVHVEDADASQPLMAKAACEMQRMLKALHTLHSVRHKPLNKMAQHLKKCAKHLPKKTAIIQSGLRGANTFGEMSAHEMMAFAKQRAKIQHSWWRRPKRWWFRWKIPNYNKKYAAYCAYQATSEVRLFILRQSQAINNNNESLATQRSLGRKSMLSQLIQDVVQQLTRFVQSEQEIFINEDDVSVVKITLLGVINHLAKDLVAYEHQMQQDEQGARFDESAAESHDNLHAEEEPPSDFFSSVDQCITRIVYVHDLVLCPMLNREISAWGERTTDGLSAMYPFSHDAIVQLAKLQTHICQGMIPRLHILVVQQLLLTIRETYAIFKAKLDNASLQKLLSAFKAFESSKLVAHILSYPQSYEQFKTMQDSSGSGIQGVLVHLLKANTRRKGCCLVEALGALKTSLGGDQDYSTVIQGYLEVQYQKIYTDPLTASIDWYRWQWDLAKGHSETLAVVEEMRGDSEHFVHYQALCKELYALQASPVSEKQNWKDLAGAIKEVIGFLQAKGDSAAASLQHVLAQISIVSKEQPELTRALKEEGDASVEKQVSDFGRVSLPFAGEHYSEADLVLINQLFPKVDIMAFYTGARKKWERGENLSLREHCFVMFLSLCITLKEVIGEILQVLETEEAGSPLRLAWERLGTLYGAQQECVTQLFELCRQRAISADKPPIEIQCEILEAAYRRRKEAIEVQYSLCLSLFQEKCARQALDPNVMASFEFLQSQFMTFYQKVFFESDGQSIIKEVVKEIAEMQELERRTAEIERRTAEIERRTAETERRTAEKEAKVARERRILELDWLELGIDRVEHAIQQRENPKPDSLSTSSQVIDIPSKLAELEEKLSKKQKEIKENSDEEVLAKLQALQVRFAHIQASFRSAKSQSVSQEGGLSDVVQTSLTDILTGPHSSGCLKSPSSNGVGTGAGSSLTTGAFLDSDASLKL